MGASKEECIRWCTLCHLVNTTKPRPYAAAMWPFVTTCTLLCTVVGDLASDHNHTCVMVNKISCQSNRNCHYMWEMMLTSAILTK